MTRLPPGRRPLSRVVSVLTVAALAVLGLPLLTASPARAATPTFRQVRANEIRTGNVDSLAFSSANTAGSLIAVYLIWDNLGAASIADTLGNTYVAAGPRTTWGAN